MKLTGSYKKVTGFYMKLQCFYRKTISFQMCMCVHVHAHGVCMCVHVHVCVCMCVGTSRNLAFLSGSRILGFIAFVFQGLHLRFTLSVFRVYNSSDRLSGFQGLGLPVFRVQLFSVSLSVFRVYNFSDRLQGFQGLYLSVFRVQPFSVSLSVFRVYILSARLQGFQGLQLPTDRVQGLQLVVFRVQVSRVSRVQVQGGVPRGHHLASAAREEAIKIKSHGVKNKLQLGQLTTIAAFSKSLKLAQHGEFMV